MEMNLDNCPLCGTELSQTKYREIKAKLRVEQEQKAAELNEARLAMKRQMEQDFKLQIQEQGRLLEKKLRGESEQAVRKANADAQLLADKLKAAEAREAQVRTDMKAEIEKQKQTAIKKAQEDARREADVELRKLASERDNATKQLTLAKEREAQIRKQIEQQAEKDRQAQLEQQRQALEKDKTMALLKQQADFNRKHESLQQKFSLLQHQFNKKTANELGESGEINLFEELRELYQGDREEDKLRRVPKGQNGPDILQEVMYKGESCGLIVIENKNRQDWKDEYATKLRQDQMDAGAEHAILATIKFPANKKHLCFKSGVILVAPHLVTYIVDLLRTKMIESHKKGLSIEQRALKMGRLYALMTSESYSTKFARMNQLIKDALELDVKEKDQHDKTWRTRGTFLKQMQNLWREIGTDVDSVIEQREPTPTSSAQQRSLAIGA
jgi:hypothetical protein